MTTLSNFYKYRSTGSGIIFLYVVPVTDFKETEFL